MHAVLMCYALMCYVLMCYALMCYAPVISNSVSPEYFVAFELRASAPCCVWLSVPTNR